MQEIKLLLTGIIVHIILFASVFDIYFKSPIFNGMKNYASLSEPPARRIVLFVADGLRAETFFELNDLKESERAPYLFNVCEKLGVWGVSHTHVPTESRPGHVALIGGFYEDPSSITKGWQENAVPFDSVFNQSRKTWSWGSRDILTIFSNVATKNNVEISTYPDSLKIDFSSNDASILDDWVFNEVEKFFTEAKQVGSTKSQLELREDKLIFFLHLLGLDTNGHSHKPNSHQYIENIMKVDKGIKKVVQIIENFFGHDSRTTYVFTSDHGMTDWGSHGAGDDHETQVPFIAWGAGIRKPIYLSKSSLSNWNFNHVYRRDLEQADIAALMATAIGTPFPANSVGKLPIDLFDIHPEHKAYAMLANAKQILAQYQVLKSQQENNIISNLLHVPFVKFFNGEDKTMIMKSTKLLERNLYDESIKISEKVIDFGLEAVQYYHRYYRSLLQFFISVSYLAYIVLIFIQLSRNYTNFVVVNFHSSILNFKKIILLCIISIIFLIYLIEFPLHYFFYFFMPVYLCTEIVLEMSVLKVYASLSALRKLFISILPTLIAVEMLVLSFFYREFLTITLVCLCFWHLYNTLVVNMYRVHWNWIFFCCTVSIFPLMPTIGKTSNSYFVCLAGCLTTCIVIYILEFNQDFFTSHRDKKLIFFNLVIYIFSVFVSACSMVLFEYEMKLPVIFSIFSWCSLISAFVLPLFSSNFILLRLFSIMLSFSVPFILLSTSHEALFFVLFWMLLIQWLVLEHKICRSKLSLQEINFSNSYQITKKEKYLMSFEDIRRAYFSLFFTFFAFFAIGNVASINSFDPMSIKNFIVIFNPFIMFFVLMTKILIPFLSVSCVLCGIVVVTQMSVHCFILLMLAMSDLMALNFFFFVTDKGSWLDIGTSLSHFVICEVTVIFILILYYIAYFLTHFSLFSYHSKKLLLNKSA